MKTNFFAVAMICCLFAGFAACSNDDEPKEKEGILNLTNCVYVASQGDWGTKIPAALSYYDYEDHSTASNAFEEVNGRSLGVLAETGLVYGSKMYIAVSESSTIEVLDATTLESIKQISVAESEANQPRSVVGYKDKIYVSMYSGYVSQIDTLTLEIEKSLKVGPNPEVMAVHHDMLFVPNSDGLSYTGFGTTASVINLPAFDKVDEMTVPCNPTKFMSDGTHLYLQCMGNYYDIPAAVYKVVTVLGLEGKVYDTIKIADATISAVGKDCLYMINSPWGTAPEDITYTCYYSGSDKIATFRKGCEDIPNPAAMGVNPKDGSLVITTYESSNYDTYMKPGYALLLMPDGKITGRFDVGYNPCAIFFGTK